MPLDPRPGALRAALRPVAALLTLLTLLTLALFAPRRRNYAECRKRQQRYDRKHGRLEEQRGNRVSRRALRFNGDQGTDGCKRRAGHDDAEKRCMPVNVLIHSFGHATANKDTARNRHKTG